MNRVFFILIVSSFAVAAFGQFGLSSDMAGEGPMAALSLAALKAAEGAVTLGLGLIGSMALFLGIMKVAESAGLTDALARLLRPLLQRLFPEVPPGHPAMGAMVMNVAANMLGLSNAATPFGVKAMQELDKLNPEKGTASDAMVLFLALNTANVTLLPTHVMALRATLGAHDPAAILPTTLFATFWAAGLALLAAKFGGRWFPLPQGAKPVSQARAEGARPAAPSRGLLLLCLAGLLAVVPLMLLWGRILSPWIIPALMVLVLSIGLWRQVAVYEAFVEGAKDGLAVSLRILPYLVAVLMAVAMFRESGAMALLLGPLARVTTPLGAPPEVLTMAGLRCLSGSASFGYLSAMLQDPAIGPDGYLGILLSTIYASSETTFYVLAVYFGAIGVRRIRHALLVGLLADFAGLIFSIVICSWLYR
ncbi:MAG TPA: spore maturation protein [Rhodospirillaceae bacterium]|nr:spore maturation protein [Rhodospirillaceae bacterium]